MADKVYFGVPGAIREIRAPESGMDFTSNVDNEVTELVSGGRSVYRAPTTFKSFSLSWKAGSSGLRHLIDMFNGQLDNGPYYITDPSADQENVLPARWSNSYQLAYQANGWCRPKVVNTGKPNTPDPTQNYSRKSVLLTQRTSGSNVPTSGILKTRVIRVPGKPYYLSVQGSRTGASGIIIRGYNEATDSWVVLSTFTTLTGVSTLVLSASDTNYSMLELDVYMPLSSTLTLTGIALGTVDHSALQNVVSTNLIRNPSFEVDTFFWTMDGVTGTVTAANSTMVKSGTKQLLATADGTNATGTVVTNSSGRPLVSPGEWFGAKAFVATEGGNYQTRLQIAFRDSTGATIAGGAFTTPWTATPFYTGATPQVVAQAPAGTVSVAVYAQFRNGSDVANPIPAGKRMWVDTFRGFKGTTRDEVERLLGMSYFDGDTVDDPTAGRWYRWTGAAHLSASSLLSKAPTDYMPVGQGVGAIMPTGSLSGTLVSNAIDRRGLTLDFVEVQNVERMQF